MQTPHLALSSNEGFLIRRYRSVYLLKVFFCRLLLLQRVWRNQRTLIILLLDSQPSFSNEYYRQVGISIFKKSVDEKLFSLPIPCCFRTGCIVRTVPGNKISISSDYFFKSGIARHYMAVTLHLYKVNSLTALFTRYRMEYATCFSLHFNFLQSNCAIELMKPTIPSMSKTILP